MTDVQWAHVQDLLSGRAGHMGCPAVNLACLSMLHSIAAVLRYLGVIRLRGCPQNHLKGLTMRRMQAILINASAEAALTS